MQEDEIEPNIGSNTGSLTKYVLTYVCWMNGSLNELLMTE